LRISVEGAISIPLLYQTLVEIEREAVDEEAVWRTLPFSEKAEVIMPKGARGSGTARKSLLTPEEARQERERLQAQLKALEEQDLHRYAAIGRAVEKEAESDPKLAEQLHGILERNVTDRGERMCLGLTSTRRGGRRRVASGELSADAPDRGADMA
jgi:hypothetical protein